MAELDDYEALNKAITSATGLPIVTKWLLLGEAIDEDGDRLTFHVRSQDCALWDELGFMEWRKENRLTERVSDVLTDDDDRDDQ